MAAQFLLLAVLPLLLGAAALYDITSFTIPNWLNLAIALAFVVFAVALPMDWSLAGQHVLAALAGLAVGFTLFALGYIGGGDAKLFAAVLLWLGWGDLLNYMLLVSLFGGALTLLLLFARRVPIPATLGRHAWISRLHHPKSGIPYGVALAAGLFAILPQAAVLRLVALG